MLQNQVEFPPNWLMGLIAPTHAEAILVVDWRDQAILGSAGRLSQAGFEGLANKLVDNWGEDVQDKLGQDMVLSVDEEFYSIFVKNLPRYDLLIGLVFPSNTPLSTIRQDIAFVNNAFLKRLQSLPKSARDVERSLQSVLKPYPKPDPLVRKKSPPLGQPTSPVTKGINDQKISGTGGWVHLSAMLPEEAIQTQDTWSPQDSIHHSLRGDLPDGRSKSEREPFTNDMPWQAIDMDKAVESDLEKNAQEIFDNQIKHEGEGDLMAPEEGKESWRFLSELPHANDDLVSILQEDFDLRDAASGLNEWMVMPDSKGDLKAESNQITYEEEITFEENDPAAHSKEIEVADITFYLVPRKEHQFILGEFAHKLRTRMIELCQQYGWQLSFLSIRPNYLKWSLHDFPKLLAKEMLEIVRMETSKCIIKAYPDLCQGGQQVDFWSPGYLMDMQNRSFSTQALMAQLAVE
jgi:REP element-mobilizing transposase RayT